MKIPTIHYLVSGKSLCGKSKGLGSSDIKDVKKALQPCETCLKLAEKKKENNGGIK